MTRAEALAEADRIIEALLQSGDETLFAAARKADGTTDYVKLVAAALRSRERIADKLIAGEL